MNAAMSFKELPQFLSTNTGPPDNANAEAKLGSSNKASYASYADVAARAMVVLNQMVGRLACAVTLCGMSVATPGVIDWQHRNVIGVRACDQNMTSTFSDRGHQS